MNTNPNAKVVLCFGDSNTHGAKPDGSGRYPSNMRWTGQLQQKLGDDFYVIEEGLGGRTTNLNDPREEKPGRDGLSYFKPCLFSHEPVHMIVIMLGTNDFKNTYDRSPEEVANVLVDYCKFVHEFDRAIKILLVSPAPFRVTEPVVYYDEASSRKSAQLAPEIKRVSQENEAEFIDASKYVELGADGLHWVEDPQGEFAEQVAKVVKDLV